MTSRENQGGLPQEAKKRKRQGEKLRVKVPRKENFVKKILGNDKATKESSFLKRRPTLIAKARQLQQLCSVSVGLVIQAPDGSIHTWPENEEELKELIVLYKEADTRSKKEYKLLEFLVEKKRKLEKRKDVAVRVMVDQLVAAMSTWLDGLSGDSMMDYVNLLDKKVDDLKEKISVTVGCHNKVMNNAGPSSSPGVTFGDTVSFPEVGVDNFLTQHSYGASESVSSNIGMPLPISVINNGDSSNFYSSFGAENNFGATTEFNFDYSWVSRQLENTVGGIDNDIMILPNPSNVHVSPLGEVLPNSVWSPRF